MTTQPYFIANPVVSCGDEGDEGAVLFNPDTDDTVILNLSGKQLWHLLATPQTAEQLIAHLLDTYQDASPDRVTGDVQQFLEALLPDFVQEVENDGSSIDQ